MRRPRTALVLPAFALLAATHSLRGQETPSLPPPPSATSPATTEAPPPEDESSPYHVALAKYKTGDYEAARAAIDEAEKDTPGDIAIEVLKARILTEQKQYAEGEKLLRSLLTPTGPLQVQIALGDLLLHKHSFERAAKYYKLALAARPGDPDLTLKMVYAKVGASELVEAGEYASHLSPMDPKNPYDDHASYYFAKAALDQAAGNSQGADDDIQNARTNYGITVTDRYLRTYLEVFAPSPDKNTDITPAPLAVPSPGTAKP